jgi:esterase/lipase superfamily enzyme
MAQPNAESRHGAARVRSCRSPRAGLSDFDGALLRAVNFALRHPDVTKGAIGMSGLCDIRRFADGDVDDNVYFDNPVEFIQHEHDPHRLEQLRRLDHILVTGRDDVNRPSNETLSRILWDKGI